MAKPTAQERRKQALRQRRADEQREYDRQDAGYLFDDAIRADRSGDIPAADRLLKKALILDPTHVGAMELLAQIHQAAGHDAEALGYLQRLRKVDTNPRAIYNIAVLHHQLGQEEKALEAVRDFLSAIEGRREPELLRMRRMAESLLQVILTKTASQKPVPPPARSTAPESAAPPPAKSRPSAPAPPAPAPTTPSAPEHPPEPPRAAVQFFPTTTPAYANRGTIADYFLRLQWVELQMAQNFEDLLCLPSLHGVDAYIYQQETVRNVLRHFKSRALLADEVDRKSVV